MSQSIIEDPKLLAIIIVAITVGLIISFLSQTNLPYKRKPASLSNEQRLRIKIQDIITSGEKRVEALAKDYPDRVDRFLKKFPEPQNDNVEYVTEKQVLEDIHTKIGEFLLRALINLDGLELPSELPELRQERRAGIKKIQSLISTADMNWAKIAN